MSIVSGCILILFLYFSGDRTGLPRPPAFLDPSVNEEVILENGVNYASGGGGILNETGAYFVSVIFIHYVSYSLYASIIE